MTHMIYRDEDIERFLAAGGIAIPEALLVEEVRDFCNRREEGVIATTEAMTAVYRYAEMIRRRMRIAVREAKPWESARNIHQWPGTVSYWTLTVGGADYPVYGFGLESGIDRSKTFYPLPAPIFVLFPDVRRLPDLDPFVAPNMDELALMIRMARTRMMRKRVTYQEGDLHGVAYGEGESVDAVHASPIVVQLDDRGIVYQITTGHERWDAWVRSIPPGQTMFLECQERDGEMVRIEVKRFDDGGWLARRNDS